MSDMDLLTAIGDLNDDMIYAAVNKQHEVHSTENSGSLADGQYKDIQWEETEQSDQSIGGKRKRALILGALALAAIAVIVAVMIKLIPSPGNPVANEPERNEVPESQESDFTENHSSSDNGSEDTQTVVETESNTENEEEENEEPSELDLMFEEDRLILTEVGNDPADMLSEEMYKELKESFNGEDLSVEVISCAPAGNSGFALVNDTLYVYDDGIYHMPYPSETRGVEDVYGNLDAWFRKLTGEKPVFIGNGETVYSPDGRFAVVFDSNSTLTTIDLTQDPIIIDLSTGEFILTETFPSRLNEENASAPVSGVFSSDGKYFYYILRGKLQDAQTRLYRYDLYAESTEICLSFEEDVCLPHLAELPDGSLIVLNDSKKETDTTGVIYIWCENGEWQKKQWDHALPLQYFHPSELDYSGVSGYAAMMGTYFTEMLPLKYGFQVFLPEQDFEGLDRYLCIENETNAVRVLTPEEYQAVPEIYAEAVADPDNEEKIHTDGYMSLFPYQIINWELLSPDGKYLLLYTVDQAHLKDTWKLLLVRLEDFEVRQVKGINEEELLPWGSMEWNSDLLILNTINGIHAFGF